VILKHSTVGMCSDSTLVPVAWRKAGAGGKQEKIRGKTAAGAAVGAVGKCGNSEEKQ